MEEHPSTVWFAESSSRGSNCSVGMQLHEFQVGRPLLDVFHRSLTQRVDFAAKPISGIRPVASICLHDAVKPAHDGGTPRFAIAHLVCLYRAPQLARWAWLSSSDLSRRDDIYRMIRRQSGREDLLRIRAAADNSQQQQQSEAVDLGHRLARTQQPKLGMINRRIKLFCDEVCSVPEEILLLTTVWRLYCDSQSPSNLKFAACAATSQSEHGRTLQKRRCLRLASLGPVRPREDWKRL